MINEFAGLLLTIGDGRDSGAGGRTSANGADDQAKAQGIKVTKGLFPWTASGRAIALRSQAVKQSPDWQRFGLFAGVLGCGLQNRGYPKRAAGWPTAAPKTLALLQAVFAPLARYVWSEVARLESMRSFALDQELHAC